MKHLEWIEEIRAIGGISDGEDEANLALAGASYFCLDHIKSCNIEINSFIECGIKYIAAYMVSCAKHDSSVWKLHLPSYDYRPVFKEEASKNVGVIADLLNQAGNITPRTLDAFIVSAGLQLRIAPTGRGKGVGRIG